MAARLNYLELPVKDTARAKTFYHAAFGMGFADFGPTYAATTSGDTDPYAWAAAFPLESPIIHVKQSSMNKGGHWPFTAQHNKDGRIQPAKLIDTVKKAGGTITCEIFSFPGGRRFHFRDPDGHEIGVTKTEHA